MSTHFTDEDIAKEFAIAKHFVCGATDGDRTLDAGTRQRALIAYLFPQINDGERSIVIELILASSLIEKEADDPFRQVSYEVVLKRYQESGIAAKLTQLQLEMVKIGHKHIFNLFG